MKWHWSRLLLQATLPEEVSQWPHDVSQWPHDVSQWPHDVSQWPHDVSQWPHDVSQWPHDVSQWPHDVSQWSHDVSQWPHDLFEFGSLETKRTMNIFYAFPITLIRAIYTTHLILFHLITLIVLGEPVYLIFHRLIGFRPTVTAF
jgi:hypothetical protein